ncbi:MAG: Mur ligase domain-containing protein [Bryobacterales bacterium]
MTIDLSVVGEALGSGRDAGKLSATGWSIDSRTVQPGDVFFAIAGPNHDGHDHVSDAFQKARWPPSSSVQWKVFNGDATAASCSRGRTRPLRRSRFASPPSPAPRWAGRVVAVTGSNGRRPPGGHRRIARDQLCESRAEGNTSNELGLPLSILRVPTTPRRPCSRWAVNHAGEIRRMAQRIAGPRCRSRHERQRRARGELRVGRRRRVSQTRAGRRAL